MNLSNPNDPFFSPEEEVLHEYETMIENDIQCTFEELNDIIGETEVINAIELLKHGKSSGEDLLINDFSFMERTIFLIILLYCSILYFKAVSFHVAGLTVC